MAQDDDLTVREMVELTLQRVHAGENVDAALRQFGLMQYATSRTRNPDSIESRAGNFAHKFRRQVQSELFVRSGQHAATDEAYREAQDERMEWARHIGAMAGFSDEPTFRPGHEPSEQDLTRYRSLLKWEQDLRGIRDQYKAVGGLKSVEGDLRSEGGLFSDAANRTKVVTRTRYTGGVYIDEYLMDPEIGNRTLRSLLTNDDGTRILDASWRHEVLAGVVDENGVVATSLGPEDLTKHLEQYRKPEVKEHLRRAMLGLTPDESFFELGQGTIQEWVGKKVTSAMGYAGDGYAWNVKTAVPGLRLPYLPNLYPEQGDAGYADSYDALQHPVKFRALLAVHAEMDQAGELGIETSEQAMTMLSHMIDFAGVNWGAKLALTGVGKLAVKTGLTAKMAESARVGMLSGAAKKLKGVIAADNTTAGRIRAVGTTFDLRNIAEEVVYATIRNAITEGGTAMEGVSEGVIEGGAEWAINAVWRGFVGAGSWGGGKLTTRFSKTDALHPIAHPRARAQASPAELVLRDLKMRGRVREGIQRRLQSYGFKSTIIDGLSHTADAVVVGAVFGGYQAAYNEYHDEWDAMSWVDKAVATMTNLTSPEAVGNMVAYAGISTTYTGANAWRSRVANLTPEQHEALARTTEHVIGEALSGIEAETFQEFVQQFDQLRTDNLMHMGADTLHTELELSDAGAMGRVNLHMGDEGFVHVGQQRAQGMGAWQPSRAHRHKGEVRFTPVTEEEGAYNGYRYWTKPGQQYAIRATTFTGGVPLYTVVDAANPDHIIQGSEVWNNPENAAAQADAIQRREILKAAGEHVKQELIDFDILPEGYELPGDIFEFEWTTVFGGKPGMLPLEVPAGRPQAPFTFEQAERLNVEAQGKIESGAHADPSDFETLGGVKGLPKIKLGAAEVAVILAGRDLNADEVAEVIDALVAGEEWAHQVVSDALVERRVDPTPQEAQATVDAHAYDEEHVGKPPAQVVADVAEKKKAEGVRKAPKKKKKAKKGPKPLRTVMDHVKDLGGIDLRGLENIHGKLKGYASDFWSELSRKSVGSRGYPTGVIKGPRSKAAKRGLSPDKMAMALRGRGFLIPEDGDQEQVVFDWISDEIGGQEHLHPDFLDEQMEAEEAAEQEQMLEDSPFETLDEAEAHGEAEAAKRWADRTEGEQQMPPATEMARAGVAAQRLLQTMLQSPGTWGLFGFESEHDMGVIDTVRQLAEMEMDEIVLALANGEPDLSAEDVRLQATELYEASRDWYGFHWNATTSLAAAKLDPKLIALVAKHWADPTSLTKDERDGLQTWYELELRSAYLDSEGHKLNAFHSVTPFGVFIPGDPAVIGAETWFSKQTHLRKWVAWAADRAEAGGMLEKVLIGIVGHQALTGRFYSGWGLSQKAADRNEKTLISYSRRKAVLGDLKAMMSLALSDANLPMGPEGLGTEGKKLLYGVVDGDLMKGIADEDAFAKAFGEKHRHLFGVAQRLIEINNTVGEMAVQAGYLTRAQLEKMQNKWVMHAYLKTSKQTLYEAANRGDYAGILPGRNLARMKNGSHDQALRIDHPRIFEMGLADHSKAIMFLGLLHDSLDQGTMVDPAELRDATEYERRQYEQAAVDGARDAEILDVFSRRRVNPGGRQARLFKVMRDLQKRTQTVEDVANEVREREITDANGDVVRSRLAPYSPEMQRLFDNILGVRGKDGNWITEPKAITRQAAQMLDLVVQDTFPHVDPSHALQRAGRLVNEVMLHWRGVHTLFSTTHWAMSRVSDVITNHDAGLVPIGDFISSWLLGKGSWHDSMVGLQVLGQWAEGGMPNENDGTWTDEQWETIQEVKEVSHILFGSTLTNALLEGGSLTALSTQSKGDDFEQYTAEQIRKAGMSEELAADAMTSLAAMMKRFMPGRVEQDTARLKAWGVRNPQARAQAVVDFKNEYQKWEFYSKLAAYYHLKKRNPKASREKLAMEAARGTVHYGDTSIYLQQFSTNYNPFDKSSGTMKVVKTLALFLAQPFLLYQSGQFPLRLRNLQARPLQVAVSTSLLAGLGAALVAGMSEEDEEQWRRDRAGSQDSPGIPLLTKEEAEMLSMDFNAALPGGGLGPEASKHLWWVFWDLATMGAADFPALSRRHHGRVADVAKLLGSLQDVHRVATTYRDMDSMTNKQRAEALIGQFEGILWKAKTAFLDGGRAVAERLAHGDKKGVVREIALQASALGTEFTRAISPSPAKIFSRQGLHSVEAILFGNQTIREFMGDTIPVTVDTGPKTILEAGVSMLWGSQRLGPHTTYNQKLPGLVAAAEAIWPGNFGKSTDRDQKLRATRLVHDQIMEVLAGSLHEYKTSIDMPEEMRIGPSRGQGDSLDARIGLALDIGADLDIQFEDVPTLLGRGEVRSTLAKRILRESDPIVRKHATYAALQMIQSEAWEGPVMDIILQQGRLRNLSPAEFSQLVESSMRDDKGRALLEMFHDNLINRGLHDLAGPSYRIYSEIHQPSPNDEPAYTHYQELWGYFRPEEVGPPVPGEGIMGALPPGPFGVGKDIKGARKSQLGVKHYLKDLERSER